VSSPLRQTELRLRIAPDAEALVVVRRVTGALAVALGLDDSGVADLRLAVTEVCASFIAARPDPGPLALLDVSTTLTDSGLQVTVRDPASAPPGPGTGPPLPLLAALTESLELSGMAGGGMEVRMTFATP
jgi:hypothetical protein